MNEVSNKRNSLCLFNLYKVLGSIENASCMLSHLILTAALRVECLPHLADRETEALRYEAVSCLESSSLLFRKWQRQDWNSISLQSLGSQLLFCTVWFLNVYRVTWECEGILLKVTTHVSPCGLFRYRFYSHKLLADYRYVPWFITRKCLLNWSQYQICCTSWAKGVLWPVQQDVYLIFYFVIMIFDF